MLNKINIMGRLTREPQMRQTQSNISVTSFTVAVERDFSQNGNRETDFIDCVAWRGTADFIGNYFDKGDMIAVTGRLQSRKYTDRDNNNRTAWEVLVESAYFCGSKHEKREPAPAEAAADPDTLMTDNGEDGELPF